MHVLCFSFFVFIIFFMFSSIPIHFPTSNSFQCCGRGERGEGRGGKRCNSNSHVHHTSSQEDHPIPKTCFHTDKGRREAMCFQKMDRSRRSDASPEFSGEAEEPLSHNRQERSWVFMNQTCLSHVEEVLPMESSSSFRETIFRMPFHRCNNCPCLSTISNRVLAISLRKGSFLEGSRRSRACILRMASPSTSKELFFPLSSRSREAKEERSMRFMTSHTKDA
mmetsp:Transcript_5887/g.13982  ORF Transcript_5887/g.13982 Transcript_5887/m.13982 type:complete len:222 (+) Transcript_5887:271-936(+)